MPNTNPKYQRRIDEGKVSVEFNKKTHIIILLIILDEYEYEGNEEGLVNSDGVVEYKFEDATLETYEKIKSDLKNYDEESTTILNYIEGIIEDINEMEDEE